MRMYVCNKALLFYRRKHLVKKTKLNEVGRESWKQQSTTFFSSPTSAALSGFSFLSFGRYCACTLISPISIFTNCNQFCSFFATIFKHTVNTFLLFQISIYWNCRLIVLSFNKSLIFHFKRENNFYSSDV